jgi:hypothetical protein
MGFKKRDGKLHTAVLTALPVGLRLSKKDLLDSLRSIGGVDLVSDSRLTIALADLIDDGRVILDGARKSARFRRAQA